MTLTTADIHSLLHQVCDPEIPVLSIVDLGILRGVKSDGETAEITITPTYSGCPAMDQIQADIKTLLFQHGLRKVTVKSVLSPAWTTDWMTESGKQKLKAYGIAPPHSTHSVCNPEVFQREEAVPCPLCSSFNTKLISRFGSTACKALYQCSHCKEPFDYFKCH